MGAILLQNVGGHLDVKPI